MEIFYKDACRNFITIHKGNYFESIFVGDGVILEDFPNGEWPCRWW